MGRVGRPAPNKGQYLVCQSDVGEDEKRCSGCLSVLPLDHFYKASSCFRGRHNLCKECWKEQYAFAKDDGVDARYPSWRRRKKTKRPARWEVIREYEPTENAWMANRNQLVVVFDPSFMYPKGSVFRWWDFMTSLAGGDIWENGMILSTNSDRVKWKVEGTALLRLQETT